MRHAARPLVAVLVIAGFAAAASCLIKDQNHCANNDGNADCTEAGFSYCSSCVTSTEHRGCVAEPPPEKCRVEGGVAGTAGTTDGPTTDGPTPTGGDDDDGVSTGAVGCTNNGALDEACPAEAPYCLDGTCAGCDATDEAFCAGVDASLPVCGAAGACVACSADDPGACTAEEFCSPLGVCGGCTSHDQCAPAGCESEMNGCQACDFVSGDCFDGNVFWVSLDDCTASEEGTYEQPYCQVGTAMANASTQDEFTVRVLPSTVSYDGPVNLNASGNKHIAVVGHGGRPTFTGSTYTGNVTGLSNRLFLSGLVLEDGTESTARCASGRLWLDDVIVRGGPVGVTGDNCTLLSISNSVITGADEVGVAVTGEVGNSGLRIVNSSVVNNGSEAAGDLGGISISDVVGWTIDYSTVVGNLRDPGVAGSGLFCSGSISGTVRNSIFLSGKGTEAISCFSADFASTVSDTPELPGDGNVHHVYAPSEFVNPGFGEAHLATNADPDVFRIAVWRSGDPATDVDGDPRPLVDGAADWAGFDALP